MTASSSVAENARPDRSGDLRRVRRSVLDLAVVPDGASSAEALADTTALAQRAEELARAIEDVKRDSA